jgi:hypothetical protein
MHLLRRGCPVGGNDGVPRIDVDRARIDSWRTPFARGRELRRQLVWCPEVIVVAQGNALASSAFEATVPGAAHARGRVIEKNTDACIVHLPQELLSIVRRRVVHNHDFEIDAFLSQDAG